MSLDVLLVTDSVGELRQRTRRFMSRTARAWEALRLDADDRATVERETGVVDYLQPQWHAPASYGVTLPHGPSLALANLATVIGAAGYRVRTIDNLTRLPWRYEQARSIVETEQPRVVGLSTTFLAEPLLVERVVGLIRHAAPEAILVVGGPTAAVHPSLHRCGDYTVFGAGESAMVEILRALDRGQLASAIPGVARWDGEQVVYGPGATRSAHILGDQAVPIPDWSAVARDRGQVYPIELSRGCRFNCAFCSHERGSVMRPRAEIAAELTQNAALGIHRYRVVDASFTSPLPGAPRFAHEFCQLIVDLGLELSWSCYARADHLDDELAGLLVRSGCWAVFLGVESGDDSVLRAMHKGHDADAARRAIEVAQRAGLHAHANFLVGFPGESRETVANTVAFIEAARPDSVAVGQFSVDALAPVARDRPGGLEGDGLRWSHATMSSDEADALVEEVHENLGRAGVNLGSEALMTVWHSYGSSVSDLRDLDRDTQTLASGVGDVEAARHRLRTWILGPLARAVAEDQASMRQG